MFGSSVVTLETIEFRVYNQTSLIFLVPYILTLFMGKINNKLYFLVTLGVIINTIVVFLSGRRALQLALILGFLLFKLLSFKFGVRRIHKKVGMLKKIVFSFGVLLISVLVIVFFLEILENVSNLRKDNIINSILHTFSEGFNFKTNKSGIIRKKQTMDLLTGAMQNLLVGHGVNSYVKSNIRNTKTPWSYEMVYIAFLFQNGLLGIIILFFIFFVFIKNLYNRTKNFGEKKIYYLALLNGTVNFILGGATNPMIYYVWFWLIFFLSFKSFKLNK